MIAILTDPSVGGTFLTWSVYFLSGRTDYFSVGCNSIIPVIDSPLKGKNAHLFSPNQLNNINELSTFSSQLKNRNECLYMHQLRSGTQIAVDRVCSDAKKIIVLSRPLNQALYHCRYTVRADVIPSCDNNTLLSHSDDIFNDFVSYFFKESKEKWDQAGLHEIWDKREFIALNFNPFDVDCIINYVNHDSQHYQLHTNDLWLNFEHSVTELFEYLELAVDPQRYTNWVPVYRHWKKQHTNRLRFIWYFETIVDSIIHNYDFDLRRLELDIMQEAAIQHALIYRHNLNVKTWQLTKFTNTKQLHSLLEPNIHNLNESLIKRLTT